MSDEPILFMVLVGMAVAAFGAAVMIPIGDLAGGLVAIGYGACCVVAAGVMHFFDARSRRGESR